MTLPVKQIDSQQNPFPWQEFGVIATGFLCIWLVLDRTAQFTQSTLGEAGILIGLVVLVTTFGVETLIFRQPVSDAVRSLGLGRPNWHTMLVAILICMLLLAFYPAFALITGAKLTLHDRWLALLPGLFAQAGIAEEVLFRGYLFGHLRRTRTFWQAALLALLPFVTVHLFLFASLDWTIALASTLLAVATAIPLCALYDRNHRTIWAAALVHWVIQGAIKLAMVPEGFSLAIALGWMAMGATVPYVVFAFRNQESLGG
jgi:membrane protease YdiL (CAAX protease family)